MSREYKFRAWDNSIKKMITQDDSDRIDKILHYLETHIKTTIMQFTGLYDTNKIEIYEGDYMLDGHSGGWGEVKYIKGAFVVEFDGEYQDLYDWTCECVIGNIYENLEINK